MSSRSEEQWNAMLRYLAERDSSVELSRGVSGDDAAVVMYRTRLFAIADDNCIIVETPRQAVRDGMFRIGDDIDLTLMVNSERMVATCTLHETLSYQVNQTLRVTSYRLSAGRRPAREQRRSFFRVSIAAMELKPVKLSSRIDGERFECEGRLSNISAGGVGVSVRASRGVLNQIKRTRRFQCKAWISETDQVQVPVRVAHISAIGDDGLYLGLQFEVQDPVRLKQLEQQMQQRCTEIQRMQLQRRRA